MTRRRLLLHKRMRNRRLTKRAGARRTTAYTHAHAPPSHNPPHIFGQFHIPEDCHLVASDIPTHDFDSTNWEDEW